MKIGLMRFRRKCFWQRFCFWIELTLRLWLLSLLSGWKSPSETSKRNKMWACIHCQTSQGLCVIGYMWHIANRIRQNISWKVLNHVVQQCYISCSGAQKNYFLLKQGQWEITDHHFGTVVFKFLRKLSHAERCSCCSYWKIKTLWVEVEKPNVAGEQAEASYVSVCH